MISKDKMIRHDWAEQQISELVLPIEKEQQAWEQQQQMQQTHLTRLDPGPSTLVSNDAQTTPSQPQAAMHIPDPAEAPISHSDWTSCFFDPSAPLDTSDDLSLVPSQSVPSPLPQSFVHPSFYWPSM